MHRQAVGSSLPGHWNLAESTEGHFSVRLPIAFNDFTVDSPGDDAEVVRIFIVGGKSPEDLKFTAMRMIYRDGEGAAQRYFKKFCEEPIFGDDLKQRRRLVQDGRDAVQLTAANSRSWTTQRAVKVGSDLVLMIAEAPVDSAATAAQLADTVFASFKVEPSAAGARK